MGSGWVLCYTENNSLIYTWAIFYRGSQSRIRNIFYVLSNLGPLTIIVYPRIFSTREEGKPL